MKPSLTGYRCKLNSYTFIWQSSLKTYFGKIRVFLPTFVLEISVDWRLEVLYFYPVRLNLLMWVCWVLTADLILIYLCSDCPARSVWERERGHTTARWCRRRAWTLSFSAGSVTCSAPALLHICHNKMTPHYTRLALTSSALAIGV